jgi:hypothetical protein
MSNMSISTECVRELHDTDLDAVTGGANMPDYRMAVMIVAATTSSGPPQQSALGDLYNSMINEVQKAGGGSPR